MHPLRLRIHFAPILRGNLLKILKEDGNLLFRRKMYRDCLTRPQESVFLDLRTVPVQPAFGRFQGDEEMSPRAELPANYFYQVRHSLESRVVDHIEGDDEIKKSVPVRDVGHAQLIYCRGESFTAEP